VIRSVIIGICLVEGSAAEGIEFRAVRVLSTKQGTGGPRLAEVNAWARRLFPPLEEEGLNDLFERPVPGMAVFGPPLPLLKTVPAPPAWDVLSSFEYPTKRKAHGFPICALNIEYERSMSALLVPAFSPHILRRGWSWSSHMLAPIGLCPTCLHPRKLGPWAPRSPGARTRSARGSGVTSPNQRRKSYALAKQNGRTPPGALPKNRRITFCSQRRKRR
jgi:hypothetical protein